MMVDKLGGCINDPDKFCYVYGEYLIKISDSWYK